MSYFRVEETESQRHEVIIANISLEKGGARVQILTDWSQDLNFNDNTLK